MQTINALTEMEYLRMDAQVPRRFNLRRVIVNEQHCVGSNP
jgi:hypothetical protein